MPLLSSLLVHKAVQQNTAPSSSSMTKKDGEAKGEEEAKRVNGISTIDNHLLVRRTFYFISIYCRFVFASMLFYLYRPFFLLLFMVMLLCESVCGIGRYFGCLNYEQGTGGTSERWQEDERNKCKARDMHGTRCWKIRFSVCYIMCLMVASHLGNPAK